ncbi:MAG TPA: hypothetical protein ENJ07_00255 [Gammaproteobacteria bacterium]|nr:hypothetical protein [Gammaproteobacteria bacterium]
MARNNNECPSPLPESWIFCDDFEAGEPNSNTYFELNLNSGNFHLTTDQSASGNHSMEVQWDTGMVEAGNLKVTFGDAPMKTIYRSDEQFDEVYWRMYVRHQDGWQGSPDKLSRATMFVENNWSQGMIAHLWSAGDVLLGDPAHCIADDVPICTKYNDFIHLKWLGQMRGETPIFSSSDAGQWRCIEGRVRLNTPGLNDGIFEFWIDDNLESSRSDLNWRGAYTDHGINAVFFENYWNAGAPEPLKRWFDDLAIATTRIGCHPTEHFLAKRQ